MTVKNVKKMKQNSIATCSRAAIATASETHSSVLWKVTRCDGDTLSIRYWIWGPTAMVGNFPDFVRIVGERDTKKKHNALTYM